MVSICVICAICVRPSAIRYGAGDLLLVSSLDGADGDAEHGHAAKGGDQSHIRPWPELAFQADINLPARPPVEPWAQPG
jgi:hypothetical protein